MKSITSKFINEVENIFTLEYQFYEHQAQKKIAQIDDEIEDVKRNIKSIDLNQQVFLNIGGGVFITSAETLVRYSAGLLAQIAVEAKNQSTIRTFFIDRDPTHFRTILNYLRNGAPLLPDDTLQLKELQREAQYYGLLELDNLITLKINSEIATPKPIMNDNHLWAF